MKLEKKKALAAHAIGVGEGRIVFNRERLADIKEAITKQDMRELARDGAISVREIKGRRAVVNQKRRRRHGSVRKKVKKTKQEYTRNVRILRAYLKQLRRQQSVGSEHFIKLRKEIRARKIISRTNLRERIAQLTKT